MKLYYILFILFFNSLPQDYNYEIIYEQGLQDKNDEYKVLKGIEYSLIANKDESFFMRKKTMVNDIEGSNERFVHLSGGSGSYYTNNSYTLYQMEYKDNDIIISLKNESNWQITNESKIISGYKCFKAVYIHESYNEIEKKYNISKTYAWFTPEIPISFGPTRYSGLPGLILQIRPYGGRIYFTATSVKKTANKITQIKSNDSISEDQFAKLTHEENSALRNKIREKLKEKN